MALRFPAFVLCLAIAPLAGLMAESARPQHASFAFEGEVVRSGDALSQVIQPRQVLSGSFRWDLATRPDPLEPAFAVYENALTEAEFTLDRHFIVQSEGRLASAANHVVIHLGDTREPSPDSLSLHLPLAGGTALNGLRPVFLELYFRDDAARALNDVNLPDRAPVFPQAWFVLTWQDDSGETSTLVEGVLTRLHLLDPGTPLEPDAFQLREMVHELDQILQRRDALIARLERDLEVSRQQTASLEATLARTREALSRAEEDGQARVWETRNNTLRAELDAMQALQADTEGALTESRLREEKLRLSHENLLKELAQLRLQAAPPPVAAPPSPPDRSLREVPRFLPVHTWEGPAETPDTPALIPSESKEEVLESPEPEASSAPAAPIRRGPRR